MHRRNSGNFIILRILLQIIEIGRMTGVWIKLLVEPLKKNRTPSAEKLERKKDKG